MYAEYSSLPWVNRCRAFLCYFYLPLFLFGRYIGPAAESGRARHIPHGTHKQRRSEWEDKEAQIRGLGAHKRGTIFDMQAWEWDKSTKGWQVGTELCCVSVHLREYLCEYCLRLLIYLLPRVQKDWLGVGFHGYFPSNEHHPTTSVWIFQVLQCNDSNSRHAVMTDNKLATHTAVSSLSTLLLSLCSQHSTGNDVLYVAIGVDLLRS